MRGGFKCVVLGGSTVMSPQIKVRSLMFFDLLTRNERREDVFHCYSEEQFQIRQGQICDHLGDRHSGLIVIANSCSLELLLPFLPYIFGLTFFITPQTILLETREDVFN